MLVRQVGLCQMRHPCHPAVLAGATVEGPSLFGPDSSCLDGKKQPHFGGKLCLHPQVPKGLLALCKVRVRSHVC